MKAEDFVKEFYPISICIKCDAGQYRIYTYNTDTHVLGVGKTPKYAWFNAKKRLIEKIIK